MSAAILLKLIEMLGSDYVDDQVEQVWSALRKYEEDDALVIDHEDMKQFVVDFLEALKKMATEGD